MGKLASINVSTVVGTMKRPVAEAELVAGEGVRGDAHSAPGPRAVSLMRLEDIRAAAAAAAPEALARLASAGLALGPGAYAENLTTEGLDLARLAIGDELRVGASVRLRISGIGKTCHQGCEIRTQLGDCIFPRLGVFAEVLTGGVVRPGDGIDQD
jgi:MOSC domain-containing protein YiiM